MKDIEDDYEIRIANKKDYKNIIKLNYPFDSKLLIFDGMQVRKILYGKISLGVAVYFPSKDVTAGYVKLHKINDSIWEMLGIYIIPDYRRKGLASKIYQYTFNMFKNKNVKKCIGSVSYTNQASLENVKKTWDGFLDKVIYILSSPQKNSINEIQIKKYSDKYDNLLYSIYIDNVGENWIKFLEIDKRDFLKRVFGTAVCESYSNNIIRKLLLPINIKMIQKEEEIIGYYIKTHPFLFKNKVGKIPLHLYAKNINKMIECTSALSKESFIWVGNSDDEFILKTKGFNIYDKRYICYKHF